MCLFSICSICNQKPKNMQYSIQGLIWCLLHHGMTIETVATIASRVDSFSPKRLTYIVLTKHRPCHINKCSILPLNKTIWSWSVLGQELMSNSKFITQLINFSVLELTTIVTSNCNTLKLAFFEIELKWFIYEFLCTWHIGK